MASDYRSIALLLSAGADATAADTSGRLPIDCLPKAETPYEEDAVQRSKQLLEAAMKTVTGGKKKTSISTGRQAGSNGGKSEQAVEDLPPHAAFAAQSKEAQMAAARRWAMMSDDDALRAALSSFPGREAAFKRARAAAAVRRRINVFKALSALRADDEFQRDMTEPSVAEAVHVLRHDTSKYEQYASDPRVASVLGKMRRVHAALQANGQRTLPLDEVTVPPKEIEARKHADLEQLNAMEAEFGAQIWAAAAAAGAETVEEAGAGAAAAYEEELKRVSQGEGLNEQTTSGGEDEAVERVSWKAALLQQVLRAAVMLVIAWLMNLWMARKGASAGEAPGRSEV